MNYKKMLTGLAAGLLLYVQMGSVLAAVPQDAPKDVKHILGLYYGNGRCGQFLCRSEYLSADEGAFRFLYACRGRAYEQYGG